MKFILHLPIDKVHPPGEFQTWEAAAEIAKAFERAGVSAAGLTEHPAPSAHWLHTDPAGHDALDPFTGLAFIAAATSRLKVFTNIVILPFRSPFLTAKAAATLQIFSGNRLILGVGVGHQKIEFDALGIPFNERGLLTDEALETIKLAWKGGTIVKQGRYFNAAGNESRPVPSVPPPIWIGGGSDKAVERAARWGDGWTPYFTIPTNDPTVRGASLISRQDFLEKLDRLHELRDKLGRSEPFDVSISVPFQIKTTTRDEAEKFVELTRELEAQGATWAGTVLPAPSRTAFLEYVAWFGEEVIASFNAD